MARILVGKFCGQLEVVERLLEEWQVAVMCLLSLLWSSRCFVLPVSVATSL